MRVFTCLFQQHDLKMVLLATLVCIVGALVTTRLFARTLCDEGVARFHWCFLSAVSAGAAIWSTHFIAMLGYDPAVPVSLNGTLTILSALVAVVGSGLGLLTAMVRNRAIAALCGGTILGLAIAAMHYVGMFAYRADGIVNWHSGYFAASVAAVTILSVAAVDRLRQGSERDRLVATALLVSAIVALHFIAMAAFSVTPIAGVRHVNDSAAFTSLAGGLALVALLVAGTGISTHIVDLRTRTDSQDRLRELALHDPLTGLANRRQFNEQLEASCEALAGGGAPFALLLIDLDRFKPVNDTLGHQGGDEVLRKVGKRLQFAVREGDLVARIGGDEFAVIAADLDDETQACAIAGRIVEILARPFVIDGNIAEIGGSVGVAMAGPQLGSGETLTQEADVALYAAKGEGRNRYCLFESSLNEALQRRRSLEADLRRACVRGDFHVHYQPVIDALTGCFTGAEALVRWSCPDRGEVPPSEFVPLAEELGLVSRIGAFVLRQACKDAAGWPEELGVAVNLSPVQLLDPRLAQQVAQALAEGGLAAHRLELEITETALLGNDELALRTLGELQALGVHISLDDFGTGYSSLSYLHRYPIDRIKIDRSFVQRLPSDSGSASIVRAISQLGGSLGMKVTAEGIETEEQLAFIADHGCDNVQGYLISRPLGAQDISELFRADPSRAAA